MRGTQAMRRSVSYSTTSLIILYGRPIFICMPNFDPSARESGASMASCTEPEPSMSWWRRGSATTAKILSAGAAMTRSREMVRPDAVGSVCGDAVGSVCGDAVGSVCGDAVGSVCGDAVGSEGGDAVG